VTFGELIGALMSFPRNSCPDYKIHGNLDFSSEKSYPGCQAPNATECIEE
jgi:hypothetical protein